ncbi:hypothetical protein HGA64_02190, partial [Candidatus Falkowbacteria bacterium]|nr:hypothetical protein [Candidatus Falkowbacteria bacterium]
MFYRGKTFAALLIAGAALLPAFLPAQAAGKPASPELLIYVKEPKQYWLKPAGKEVAMYLGQDKTAELGANLKRL